MIGFLGGTGPAGRGIATRLAIAGEQIFIGSRNIVLANKVTHGILTLLPSASVIGGLNIDAARKADILFITVPYAAQRSVLEEVSSVLKNKIVVNTVSPLKFCRKTAQPITVEAGSAAMESQDILPNSTVVAAFHTISADNLLAIDMLLNTDVIVCADDLKAKKKIMMLAEKINGLRSIDGGDLKNAESLENFTALLININQIYRAHSSLRIMGI